MKFHSTKNSTKQCDIIHAMQRGLAEDGGLYVPASFPQITPTDFSASLSYTAFAEQLLRDYIELPLAEQLTHICQRAFDFPVPLTAMEDNTWLLELFHGETLSFKDFGAGFLAQCLTYIKTEKPMTILVATSGDTGSAVAAAFHQSPIRVFVLFPLGKISLRQQQQITCWGDNVTAIAIDGDFDDCQRIVKTAFVDPRWQEKTQLSTANSINIGRLLPQMVYYAYTSIQFQHQHQRQAGFIVPSGNLGNVTAAYWAKKMGFPIRDIVIATNVNQPLIEYLRTGDYQAFPTISTLANAMDVGNPSNVARLQHLFPDFAQFKANVKAIQVSDEQIRQAITQCHQQQGKILCPHTATAYVARQQLASADWILVGTAHPCKFETVIEPLIGQAVPIAPQLKQLLEKPLQFCRMGKDEDMFEQFF